MGKKSGPLAFLNKKGWHPGNQRNQEKVWKKEQEALAEKKQVEELRKQYEEARQKEEIEAMAVAAGVKKKQERLDWMYQGGMVAKQEAEKRADAQMLGEKEMDVPAEPEPSKGEEVAQLPAFYTQDTPASANEMWQKLHGDPMFAIKQQELMARKKIVANPVQMDAIKQRLKAKADAKASRKAVKAEAKAARKAEKKAKKEKKRKRAEKSSSSDSDSGASEEERSLKQVKGSNGQAIRTQHSHANGGSRHSNREGDGQRNRDAWESLLEQRNGHEGRGRIDGRDNYRGHRAERNNRRETSPEERFERGSRHNEENLRDSRRRRANDHDDYRRSDTHRGRPDSHGRERQRGAEGEARSSGEQQRGNRSPQREKRRERASPADKELQERDEGRDPQTSKVKVYRDAASAQGHDLSYGLNTAKGAVDEDRAEKRRETQKRLEEAKLRREADDKEKAEQRYRRKEHKTGQLSEEEKARRLAEMSGNADAHEEARWERLQAARKRDDTEAEKEALALQEKAAKSAKPGSHHHEDTAKFLRQATHDAFGGKHASLADRVGRRKYYNDRNKDDTQGAFQR